MACLLTALGACTGNDQTRLSPPELDVFASLGEPLPAASEEQRATFERGLEVARRRFVPAMGLGPTFNVVACGDCHERPVFGGSAGRYRNFILQGQALPDGSFTPTGVNGIQDHYGLGGALGRVPDAPGTNRRALRNPIPFFGVGLVAEIDEAEIARSADPDDADADGISGRPNFDRGFIGRFGRKAQTVSIENFIRGPLFNHLGISSDPLPDALRAALPVPSAADRTAVEEPSAGGRAAASAEELGRLRLGQAAAPSQPTRDEDGAADPELAEQDLFDLVSFSMLLAAPRPEPPSEAGARGRELFMRPALRRLPHADTALVSGRHPALLRPAVARHGRRARRRHPDGRSDGGRV